ncbi:MAG: AAA+ ATPase superfamily predicted ATPase [Candidatus Omnitrophota bacterium]|jgi:AAA+ ATPase superfamily predicted ATPase
MSYIDSEKTFFGRQDTLGVLKRRVVDLKEGYRQNVALLGAQYVGKSTLLRNFITNLDDSDVIVIYLDLENKDFDYFFHKFIGSLLYTYSKNLNLILFEDINVLMENTKEYIPQTINVINKIQSDYAKDKFSECYLGLLMLPEIFTNETGKYCIMILDEFQYLEDFALPNVFQDLGNKIMTQKRCFYVLSSSYPSVAEKIISERLSLLFGNFETIQLDVFDNKTSQVFIEHSIDQRKIGLQLSTFLTDFSGGHPLYLNLLCQELKNLSAIHNQNEIYMPLLSQAVENTIFDRWGVLSRHFELITNELCGGKGNKLISTLLIALVNEKNKLAELVGALDIKRAQVSQRLNRLIEQGVLVKNGNHYYIKDKLLKYWIKFVYQKRIKDVELAPDKQRRQFKDEFNHLVEESKVSARKDLPSRIIELLYCFDNEAFDLNGRKYRLPIFRSVETVNLKDETGRSLDMIEAKTDNMSWYIVMKKDVFLENDIGIIAEEVKRNKKKCERCLIISLADIDENARLKALQERFWIWNEGEINTLLTLFDKPYISR